VVTKAGLTNSSSTLTCTTCVSILFFKSPSATILRQMGHFKLFFVLSFSTDETKVVIQDSQNVCKHGRYLACQFNTEIVKAVSWCSTCEEGLCKSCDKCHRSFKMSSNHVLVPLAEMNSDKMSLGFRGINYCSEHNSKIIEVYLLFCCNSLDRSTAFVDCFNPAAAVSMDITVSHFR
jgi:hypothetical protein